jgi:hypothetical protein
MLAKGAYPAEMINPFPFALISNDEVHGELHVMPAFFWLHNMFAMARNNWKYATRDTRVFKVQNIEFDAYAPDSMEEAIEARKLLDKWTAKAWLLKQGKSLEGMTDEQLIDMGRGLLNGDPAKIKDLEVLGEGMEKSRRKVIILHPYEAYHAYGDMLIYYSVRNIVSYLEEHEDETFLGISKMFDGDRARVWFNLGGQLMSMEDVDQLRSDIKDGTLNSWKEIHHRYTEIWKKYPIDKLRHAYMSLKHMLGVNTISKEDWNKVLNKGIDIQNYVFSQVYETRKKDYENKFRQATFRCEDEMLAAWGKLDENSFIKQQRQETKEFVERVQSIKKRLL